MDLHLSCGYIHVFNIHMYINSYKYIKYINTNSSWMGWQRPTNITGRAFLPACWNGGPRRKIHIGSWVRLGWLLGWIIFQSVHIPKKVICWSTKGDHWKIRSASLKVSTSQKIISLYKSQWSTSQWFVCCSSLSNPWWKSNVRPTTTLHRIWGIRLQCRSIIWHIID